TLITNTYSYQYRSMESKRVVSATGTACAPAAGSAPHNVNELQAMAALGSLAVSPPRETARNASTAAAFAARITRRDACSVAAAAPPSAPARIAAAPSVAKSVIARTQCATVA